MKISTRARYGTRAMIEFALAYPERIVSVKEVAERQGISGKYLEQIMTLLKSAGLVRAVRGMHGGYALAKAPSGIKLSDIYQVLEGPIAPVDCVDRSHSCPLEDTCATRQTWQEIKEALSGVLESTTLKDLVDRKKGRNTPAGEMYHI